VPLPRSRRRHARRRRLPPWRVVRARRARAWAARRSQRRRSSSTWQMRSSLAPGALPSPNALSFSPPIPLLCPLPASHPPTLTSSHSHPSSLIPSHPHPLPHPTLIPHPSPHPTLRQPRLGHHEPSPRLERDDGLRQRLADGARVRRRSSRRARGARLDSKRAGGGYLYERAGQVVSLRSKG